VTSVGTLTVLSLSGGISGATTIGSSGAFTNSLATASTSNTTGALLLSGGIGISNATDASSSTNGGSFTTAGGMSIAKQLYVGTNLTVGGNLTITGTTTTINSTTTNITDNTLILNSGPAGTGYDAGVLTQRFQNNNATGTGDVVNDTAKATFALNTGSTTTTLVLPAGASAVDNFYTNWWVKITSGTFVNSVRQITNYVGSTRTATLNTVLSGSPISGDNINLYNKGYTGIVWNEGTKRFITAFLSSDSNSTLNIIDYADSAHNNIIGLSTTTSTSSTTGALTLAGGIGISNTTDATSSTNGGTFTTAGGMAIAKKLHIGSNIIMTNTLSSSQCILNFLTDTQNWEIGARGSTSVLPNSFYIYNGGFLLGMTPTGVTSISNTTASTSNTTGALLLSGGIGLNHSTDAISSTNGGSFTTTGGMAIAKKLYVGTSINAQSLALSGAITGVTTITATTLTGALSTAAQTAITSVGTLTSLVLSGEISGAALISTSSNFRSNLNSSTNASYIGNWPGFGYWGFGYDGTLGSSANTVRLGICDGTAATWSGYASLRCNNIYTNGTTASTSNATGALILVGGIGINNTTDASSSTNGGTFTTAGGMAIAKQLYIGTNTWIGNGLLLSTMNTGKVSTTAPTSYMNLNDSPIYFRGINASDKNHFIAFAGGVSQTSWNAGKGFGNPAAVNDGPVLCGNSSVIIGTLAGASIETICGNFTSTGLSLAGNGSTCPAPGYALDFITNSQNMQISLYAGTYGIGACNNNLQSFTGGGFTWWNTASAIQKNALAFSGPTSLMTLSSTGILTIPASTASTSNSTGALTLAGGIGISNTTDATSSTNGGSFTTAGGMSIAKQLYVGTSISGVSLVLSGTITGVTTITATTLAGALSTAAQTAITSVGTLTGLTVAGNISTTSTGTITSAGLLTASAGTITQISDAGITTTVYPLHVSHLLSSGTPTANSFGVGVLFNGPNASNTTISYARVFSTCQSSTLNAHQGNLTFSTVFGGNFIDAITISSSSSTNSTLTINGASSSLSLTGTSSRITLSGTTASTSNSTGALTLAGGIGISNTTDATGSSNGGSFTTAGGMAIAKSLRVGTQLVIGSGSTQLANNTYPLYITAWTTSTETASTAYLFGTSGAANYPSGSWGNCSARFNDVLVAAAFVSVSDRRIKTNIEEIPIEFCKSFIMNCTPVSYNFKKDLSRGRNNTQFGYIAQDLEQKGFATLVTHVDEPDNEYLIETIETIDGQEYISPQGVKLTISYEEIIPLLAQNIKTLYLENESQKTKIEILEQKNKNLEDRLAKIEQFISTLEISE
jgi:hypothetical protein